MTDIAKYMFQQRLMGPDKRKDDRYTLQCCYECGHYFYAKKTDEVVLRSGDTFTCGSYPCDAAAKEKGLRPVHCIPQM